MQFSIKRRGPDSLVVLTLCLLQGCSVLPEDIRATLPESMRGDTQALTDYPTPSLKGAWKDIDFPELTIKLTQTGNAFKYSRNGLYRGIPVKANYQGTLNGRAIKVDYLAQYPGQVRGTKGTCFGVVSKDSSSIRLTCEDTIKDTYPMNLSK